MPKRAKTRDTFVHQADDKFFKEALSQLSIARDYIRVFLPDPLVQNLDLTTLQLEKDSHLSPGLKPFFSDLVFSCSYGKPQGQVLLSFLYEHKSQPDPHIFFQLLQYMSGIWDKQHRNKQPFTPVIPLVFYHGAKPWQKQAFTDLFTLVDDHIKPFLPIFDYHLTDMSLFSQEQILQLKAGFLKSALLAFKYRYDDAAIKSNFKLIFSNPRNKTLPNFFANVFVYLMGVSQMGEEKLNELLKNIDHDIKSDIMSTYEQIAQKWKMIGFKEAEEKLQQKTKASILLNLHKEGFDVESIARILEVEPNWVREVLKEQG